MITNESFNSNELFDCETENQKKKKEKLFHDLSMLFHSRRNTFGKSSTYKVNQ